MGRLCLLGSVLWLVVVVFGVVCRCVSGGEGFGLDELCWYLRWPGGSEGGGGEVFVDDVGGRIYNIVLYNQVMLLCWIEPVGN